MKCEKCGNELVEKAKFCSFCGAKQEQAVPPANDAIDLIASDTPDNDVVCSSDDETDEGIFTENVQFAGVPKQADFHDPTAGPYNSDKEHNNVQAQKKKPNGIAKKLGIGCGTILGLFIILIIIGIVTALGHATLTIDELPGTIQEESIEVFGTTEAGNMLVINGDDYSSSVGSDGKFKASVPLQLGDNEITLIAMKENKESSKIESTVKVRRELKTFNLSLTPASGAEIDEKEIEVIGAIDEPNAAIQFYNDEIKQEVTSDSEGKFILKLVLGELATYNYTLKVEKDGYIPYDQPYVLTRVAPVSILQIDNSTPGTVTVKDVVIKGKTEPKGKVTITGDLKGDTIADSNGAFSLKLQAVQAGSYKLTVTTSKSGYQDASETITFVRELSYEEKLQQYKDSCAVLSYKILKKNPDNHKGEKVKYTGQVIQIQENDGSTFLRIAVTNLGYGIWDYNDVIAVNFGNTTDIVEDDVIRIYGTVEGTFSYTSIAGWEISIPQIEAEYIEW